MVVITTEVLFHSEMDSDNTFSNLRKLFAAFRPSRYFNECMKSWYVSTVAYAHSMISVTVGEMQLQLSFYTIKKTQINAPQFG